MGHPRTLSKAEIAREARKGSEPITEVEFRRLVRQCRKAADLPPGVRIRWKLDPNLGAQGWAGLCDDKSATRFTISIDANLSESFAFWCLCHEISHVRQRIYHPDEVDDHGPGFGIEFAFIWSRAVGEK